MMSTEVLAARLKNARTQLGLTLRDVEKATDGLVDNSQLSRIEKGRQGNIHADKLRALAKALKLDYVELLILAGHLTIRELKGARK